MTAEPRTQHTIAPIRELRATAPSGGEVMFRKYSESDRELSHGCGWLTSDEHAQYWRAKLAAERPGIASWTRAVGILEAAGWTIEVNKCSPSENRA